MINFKKAIQHLKDGNEITSQKWIDILKKGWEDFQNAQNNEYEFGYSGGVCNLNIPKMNKEHSEIKNILINAGFENIAFSTCKNEIDTLAFWGNE